MISNLDHTNETLVHYISSIIDIDIVTAIFSAMSKTNKDIVTTTFRVSNFLTTLLIKWPEKRDELLKKLLYIPGRPPIRILYNAFTHMNLYKILDNKKLNFSVVLGKSFFPFVIIFQLSFLVPFLLLSYE